MISDRKGPEVQQEFWLFGYGSLIWKPPPHYDLRVPGYITAYVRRFWQASEDHRGTPTSPGRVVTLISRTYWDCMHEQLSYIEPDVVYGTAYRIPAGHVDTVKAYLDIREVNGYSIQYTAFYPTPREQPLNHVKEMNDDDGPGQKVTGSLPLHQLPDREAIDDCLVYIGLPSNPQFLGVQTLEEVASVVATAEGPSGKNIEYLFMLEKALKGLGVGEVGFDAHVSGLVKVVKSMVDGADGLVEEGERNEGRRVRTGNTGAREETEKTVVAAQVDE